MLFTLLICFGILMAVEKVSNKVIRATCILILILFSSVCDWAFLAPVFTLLFLWSKGSKSKTGWAFIISMLLFGGLNFAGGLGRFSMETNLIYALGSMMGIALAGIVIVIFYNGRRIEKGSVFSKWFFYWFYPLHLLLLGILRVIYMGIS